MDCNILSSEYGIGPHDPVRSGALRVFSRQAIAMGRGNRVQMAPLDVASCLAPGFLPMVYIFENCHQVQLREREAQMNYVDAGPGYENVFELNETLLTIRSRGWLRSRSEHQLDLRNVDPHYSKYWFRDPFIRSVSIWAGILGIGLIIAWATLTPYSILNYPRWFLPGLFVLCLLAGIFGTLHPFRSEYALFRTTAGVHSFWIRCKNNQREEYQAFLEQIVKATSSGGA